MEASTHGNPPLSPVLLAGIALSPLPPALLQPFLNLAMANFSRRHAGLFDRLASLAGSSILIDPTDLPFALLLRPAPPPSLVVVAETSRTETPAASIRGPLLTLIALLEGRLDGDALFFSRELVVEGDTEAVVMLRNAVDGAGIDVLDELLSVLGPLARPAGRLAGGAMTLFARMDRDLGILKRAVLEPFADRSEAQAGELRELREKVAELSRQRDRRARAGRSRASQSAGT